MVDSSLHQLTRALEENFVERASRNRRLVGPSEYHTIVLQPAQKVRRARAIAQCRSTRPSSRLTAAGSASVTTT